MSNSQDGHWNEVRGDSLLRSVCGNSYPRNVTPRRLSVVSRRRGRRGWSQRRGSQVFQQLLVKENLFVLGSFPSISSSLFVPLISSSNFEYWNGNKVIFTREFVILKETSLISCFSFVGSFVSQGCERINPCKQV